MTDHSHEQELQQLRQRLEKRVAREKNARLEAENLLEDKSLDLFIANKKLMRLNEDLEKKVVERTKELQDALERANAATKAKSEFLAVMSHEIRTPMNAVLGFASLLQDSHFDSSQQNYLNSLTKSGDLLLQIINDILDFSKIEAGKLDLELIDTNLREAFSELKEIFGPQIQAKGLICNINIASTVPSNFFIDVTRFKQIFTNLISNAIKFTPSGSIDICVDPSAQPGYYKFSVKDTGIGINEEGKKRLFEAFSQADNSTTREYGGTGLGLAICASIINMMGGEIHVDTKEGEGSIFYFEIPLKPSIQHTSPDTAIKPEVIDNLSIPEGLRVLVVEDNLVNQLLAIKFLEKLGIKADTAENGLVGLEAVKHKTYDFILMDMQMPKMDGIECTIEIRKLGESIEQPNIIALTANAFDDDRKKCFDAGMDQFLSKPINLEKLATAFRKELMP